jgi:predicted permease
VAWNDSDWVIDAQFVSANWFKELGYDAFLGRVFSEAADGRDAGGDPPAVVSYDFWKTVLGGDPSAVGRTVRIDRRPVVIVGIARPDFPEIELDDTAVWLPLDRHAFFYPTAGFPHVVMLGRLRDGTTLAAARESLRATMDALSRERPGLIAAGTWLEPISGRDNFLPPDLRVQIWIMISLMATLMMVVLIVASANLGNLVLSRATGRARELGVRVALGARRSRIVRQLLVETLPLGLLGTLGAVLFAWAAAAMIRSAAQLPPYLDLSPDWRTLLASMALATVAMAVVAAIPSWKVARQDLGAAIKDGGHQVSMRLDASLVRRLLVAAQVTGCCVMLIVAGLVARRAQRTLDTRLGFEFDRVAAVWAPLDRFGIAGAAARDYWDGMKTRLADRSDVEAMALVTAPPLGFMVNRTGYQDAPGLKVLWQRVDPSYFAVMRIPILRGRTFAAADGAEASVVISRRVALAMYGTLDVVGRGFPLTAPSQVIVGVAGDAHTILVNATDVGELYRPLRLDDHTAATLLVRSRSDPAGLLPWLRAAGGADPRAIAMTRLLRDDFARRTAPARLVSVIVGATGVLTLALASLGVFGVVSCAAVLRTREIGIHRALGAPAAAVLRLITARLLWPIGLGLATGLIAAATAGSLMAGEPFYLQPLDPGVYAAALALVGAAGAAAAMLPAARVLRADPLRALRHE